MATATAVTLPRGHRLDGGWDREARLRPLTGEDELLLVDEGAHMLPAERTTTLLARCLDRVGDAPATPNDVRALTIGDREALLLHLRRLTFSDELRCVVTCPDCAEQMDIELDVRELLVEPYEDIGEDYDVTLVSDGIGRSVRVRLPTGRDQEDAAQLATDDVEAARELLLCRCVEELDGNDGRIPQAITDVLPQLLATLDPQAETRLELECTGCRGAIEVLFDAGDFLFRELAACSSDLFREIHVLAFHYGWREREILRLPSARRRRYLELVADELARERPR